MLAAASAAVSAAVALAPGWAGAQNLDRYALVRVSTIGHTTYTEGEDQAARFRVRATTYRAGGTFNDPLTVRYRVTQEGSFVDASQTGEKSVTVTLAQRWTDISIPITDDGINEADGKIKVELLPDAAYQRERGRVATVVVRDDDVPVVSFGGNTLAVGEGSSDSFEAVLNVDPAPYRDITVRVETEAPLAGRWTAAEGSDYTAASVDVPIAAGETSAMVQVSGATTSGVRIADDAAAEDYEHLHLRLRSGSGYRIPGRDWLRVTIVDDESPPPAPEANPDGTYTVPADWPLVPEELRDRGGEFRLLLLTNDWRDATSASIAAYDAHVQDSVAGSHSGGSHPAIIPYSDAFKAVASAPTVDARDHIGAGRDAPIYWMNGPRAALGNDKFWSSSWEHWARHERRTAASVSADDSDTRGNWHWSGTDEDGTKHSLSSLGSPGHAIVGQYFEEGVTRSPWVGASRTRVESNSLLGISPVFRVQQRPRLEIDTSGMSFGLLDRHGRQQMLVVDEPAPCASPPDDVSALGGVAHAADLATYRVRLYADPGGWAPMRVYNPKNLVYRQGSLATGPWETRREILTGQRVGVNDYRDGLTVRPAGEPTTYALSGWFETYTQMSFGSGNWDQWQTVSLNIHCADHEDHRAYIIQHMLELPGDRIIGVNSKGQGVNWNYSTWHDVRVKVIDTKSSPQPADLTVDTAYAGTLSAEHPGHNPSQYCTGGVYPKPDDVCEWGADFNYKWTTGDHPNDLWDATEHFASFRVRVEGDASVSPPLPVLVHHDDPDFVIDHSSRAGSNSARYGGNFRTGLISSHGQSANPGDPVYRITITPVTIRNNDVPGEAVTMCLQLQSLNPKWLAAKHSVVVDCSLFTPPADDVPVVERQFAMGAPSGPTVTISSNVASVTEGGRVTFTISADPAPESDTTVLLSVSQEMGTGTDRIGRSTSQFVTIPAGQSSVKRTVTAYSDDTALADGTVVGRIMIGDTYQLGNPSSVSLPLLDDDADATTPEVSVTAGSGVTEGGDATFTVSASPAPAADLDVSVTVTQSGDFGAVAGTRTVTVPATGSVTLTVGTADDQTDEPDGSVTATVNAGSVYTVSATQGTATVAVSDDDPPPAYAVDASVVARVQALAGQSHHGSAHVNRWNRVLVAFGAHDGTGVSGGAMTAAQAQQMADRYSSPVWDEVVAELTALEASSQQTPPPPPPIPEVSITASAGGTEGDPVTFAVSASPAPAADLAVSVTVATSGDFGYPTAPTSVTIGASGTAVVTIATADDGTDEPDGSVTLTLNAGSDYTVGSPSAETATVSDDDDPPPVVYTVDPAVVARVRALAAQTQHGTAHVNRWQRALAGLGALDPVAVTGGAMTAAQAQQMADTYSSPVWDEVVAELTALEAAPQQTPPPPPPPPPLPVVTVTGGSGVTEGGSAEFMVSASPAPAADLDVIVTIAVAGDFGITTGARTVTISASGTATLSVATTDDSADEADGSVTATVVDEAGYDLGTSKTATVAVSDNDDPPPPTPVVTIRSKGDVTEGTAASFTLTASPAPAADLDVTVTVAAAGDFGASAGQRTVTIPASGTVTLTVSTVGDSADEPDGSVTATLVDGTGYGLGTSKTATVAVSDDDPPPPPVEQDAPPDTVLAACGSDKPTLSISSPQASRSDATVDFEVSLSCVPAGRPMILVTPVRDGLIGENMFVAFSAERTTATVTVDIGSETQLGLALVWSTGIASRAAQGDVVYTD
ncbi:MAG: hypothetical protein OXH86_09160 [Acidimicrobiaceae bacterium]|nr:hypothetical protein [Acidimicrobiaceae bacterium]